MPQSKDELYWSLFPVMIAVMIAVYLLSGRVIDGWEIESYSEPKTH